MKPPVFDLILIRVTEHLIRSTYLYNLRLLELSCNVLLHTAVAMLIYIFIYLAECFQNEYYCALHLFENSNSKLRRIMEVQAKVITASMAPASSSKNRVLFMLYLGHVSYKYCYV
jgi:hypothetical protein